MCEEWIDSLEEQHQPVLSIFHIHFSCFSNQFLQTGHLCDVFPFACCEASIVKGSCFIPDIPQLSFHWYPLELRFILTKNQWPALIIIVDGNPEYRAELPVCTAHVQTSSMHEPRVRAGTHGSQRRWAERTKGGDYGAERITWKLVATCEAW